ncbi:SRPBCC family protein [Micromonospora thermarum]|uniref:SRPBCC domain-containing protein n=1 Tax=Micromonospora thermarum TaxID=2720024 RepID=A0ABX0Z4S0_9ACTN|nr:SRPBCC domain-containing protein [Micromonospora thermarum]NJP32792.1 SRPBCC domain-containing protein [Micromonospora thermarum]
MTDSDGTLVETSVHAPPERVWSALTVPEEIRQWFGWDYDGLDDEIRFIFVDHATPRPPDRISMSDGSELRLDPDGDVTRLSAVLPAPADDAAAAEQQAIAEGWRTFFAQLRFLLECRPEGQRRTAYLTGTGTGRDLMAVLGTAGSTEEWFHSPRQRIVVDPDGRLLAATAERPLDDPEPGPVSLTVSAYGIDDAGAAHLERVWAARWTPLAAGTESIM